MIDIEKMILETFIYKENPIFHVGNFLAHKNVKLTRQEEKEILNALLQNEFLAFHDDPSNGQVNFIDCVAELEEEYWFVLTEDGRRKLNY